MTQEIFKPIPDFPGYDAGNMGTVRSYHKGAGLGQGWIITATPRRILKPHPNRQGYAVVMLRRDGKTYNRTVGRLVLLTFVGPCPPGHEVCHADGTRNHDALINLSWGTRSKNHLDMVKHGRCPLNRLGAAHPATKHTEEQVLLARKLAHRHHPIEISKMLGVNRGTVRDWITRRSWAHLP